MGIFYIVVPVIICLLVAGGIFSYMTAKKRRSEMEEIARQTGLQFHSTKNYSLDEQYHFIDKLCQGDNRYGFNMILGDYRGHPVKVFDYHYETTSTDSDGDRKTHHHYFSFFVLHFNANFPELLICREGWFAKFTQFMGFEDIDFESAEFSRKFLVKSPNKKFAYDICHGQLIEYLLANTDLNIEIERHCLTFFFDRRLTAEQIRPNLDLLVTVRETFPNYLIAKV